MLLTLVYGKERSQPIHSCLDQVPARVDIVWLGLLQCGRTSMSTINNSSAPQTKLLWIAVALLGAVSFAIVALNRGEAVNAAWLVVAAGCIYFIAYRFYRLSGSTRELGVNPARPTPAQRHNDGLDYVPTNKYVLYGHHFAAIAGAGPLVGPV